MMANVNKLSHCIVVAVLSFAVVKYCLRGGLFERRDGTAQGIAKIRHYESLHKDPSMRLYYDPYAQYMYKGSFAQTWLGERGTLRIYDFIFKGMLEMITLRTKWIDDEIMKAIAIDEQQQHQQQHTDANAAAADVVQQMVILGAGYDTRGFRLDLPDDFLVIEVDQPDVQVLKRKKMEDIVKNADETVASRMTTTTKEQEEHNKSSASGGRGAMVEFLEIDFNKGDSIGEKLLIASSSSSSSSSSNSGAATSSDTTGRSSSSSLVFDRKKKTIVIFEGVTQYIPKTSTASTLKELHEILPHDSILLISYVPQDIFDDPTKCGGPSASGKIRLLLKVVKLFFGEPWISSWTPGGFQSFLYESGYELISDTSVYELNDKYLVPRNRGLERNEIMSMERYVVAAVVK